MAYNIKPKSKETIIALLTKLTDKKMDKVIFNNPDRYILGLILEKAKTNFNLTQGRSGVIITL